MAAKRTAIKTPRVEPDTDAPLTDAEFERGYGAVLAASLVLVVGILTRPVLGADASMSNAEAKQFVENEFNTSRLNVRFGKFSVMGNLHGASKQGEVTQSGFENMKILSSMGLITLQQIPFPSIWDQQFASARGVTAEVIVGLGPKGQAFLSVDRLAIPVGNFTVDRIVKNEEHKKGAQTFRVLMGLYTARYFPEYYTYYAQSRGYSLTPKRKFMMLVEFDLFSETWKWRATDHVAQDRDFTTQNVNRLLDSTPSTR